MNKNQTWRRVLTLICVMAMLIGIMVVGSVVASAAENDPAPVASGNVAKVGNTEYATIDEAIANWTNNSTLTLLADVTLSDTITLKSTEHHTLDLGTYTMTAASGKNAIEITCEGRSSASYALTVNADANNPGGITATGKACIYYSKSGSTKDRPIILINNGVFNGSYSINSKSNGNTNCPQIWIYGGTFNGNVNLTKNMLRVWGGTFNGWINCTGDQNAYRQISGGRFKSWQFMTADAPNKFAVSSAFSKDADGNWIGSYDVGAYVDDEGYLVVSGNAVTEAGETFEASSANYGGWSSYLKYSSAATNGLYYTSVEEALADNNKATGSVTVYVDELDLTGINYKGTIVVPEGKDLTVTNAPSTLKVQLADGTVIIPDANGNLTTKIPTAVSTYEELIAALAEDGAYVLMMNDITATATQGSGYGKAGIVVGAGDVLDGNGKKLTINGANSTWDCAIAMTGGEVKNLTIAGAMRGIFMPGANDNVVIDNCVFENVIYTFNSDAGSSNHTVTIKNTELNGWTSFSNVHKAVTFESCTFGEGSGYAFCRPYQATTFVDCDFAAGYELDNKKIPAADVLTFNDCTYDGEALSATNKAMFYNGGSVVIDGETTDVNPPKGDASVGYVSTTTIWGECGGNARESFIIKIYSGETYLGYAQLNNIDGILNGNVWVTWHAMLIPENETDSYWTTEWEVELTSDKAPDKIELWIDGVRVDTGAVQMNGPDNLNPVKWEELDGVKYICTGLKGVGTEADPYLINRVEDLIFFRDSVNAGETKYNATGVYVTLGADIDLGGEDWKVNAVNFTGIFDGNNYTISNFHINATTGRGAFFYKVYGATVKNLTLSNITATVAKNQRVAALTVGYELSTIDNIKVNNFKVTTTGATSWIAGLACSGYVNSEVTMSNCTVENFTVIDAYGAQFIAGITAVMQRNGTEADGTNVLYNLNVKNFKVEVNGIVANSSSTAVGGLIGQTQSVWQNPHFKNCSVTGLDVVATGRVDVGGFMAHPGSYTYATNCTVEGKIDVTGVTSASNYAGGFFGDYGWGDNVGKGDHKITNCSANVDIITKLATAGGFIGSGINTENRNKNITLTNCHAYGTVTLVEGGTATIGGFAGNANRGIYENCSAAQTPFIGEALDTTLEFKVIITVSNKAELNAALAAAQEGYIILLTADIDYGTDQLAITKAITLDLGGKTLTTRNAWGGMSVKGNATVKNGTIVHASNTAAIKVWNATAFEDLVIDVQGKGDANKTIGGIVLQSGSTTRVGSIKNVTIKGAALTNGIETYNCGDATENVIGSLENVTIDAAGTGMLISAPVGTATNCTIKGGVNAVELWIKGTYSATLTLVDCDLAGGVYAHDEFTANPDAVNNGTLNLTVSGTTNVDADDITLTLARAENVAGLVKDVKDNAQAKVNDTYYATIAEAIAAAQAGDTVTLLAGNYTVNISVKSGVTLVGETDANGNNLVNITGRVSATTGATVKNLNIHNEKTGDYDCALSVNGKDIVIDGVQLTGYNGMRYCYANGDITIKNSVINASFFALHFDGSAGGNLVIDNCDITGWVSYAGTIEKVTLQDSTFDAGAYAGQRSYTKNLVIDGCTFEAGYKLDINATNANVVVNNSKMADGSSIADLFHAEDVVAGDFTIDNSKLTYVAKIGNTHYATLEEALAAVADWTTIKLVANATLNYGAREAYGRGTTTDIIIDGQGFTLTLNQTNSDWSSIGMVNANGKLTLKNMTIEKTGYGDTTGAWNTHAIIFSCNVEMNNVTVNNSVAVQNGATLKNVTINEANEYYGLWINGNGQTVTADGLTINATNKGRGIKIADQYIDTPASVTLNLSNATFNTAKKAAVLVTSTAGANITASDVDITNVAKDSVNLAWVDSDRAEYYGNVTVTGASKGQEDVDTFAASVAKNGDVIGYYKTLADAFAVAQDGETIKLLANIALDETITNTKKVTLDLNGKTITGTDNATGSFGLITNKGELTITGNGKMTLTATNNRGWNAYSSVISNQVGGKLVVESGTIEHLGGTAMAYAIDNLTNGKGTYAETVINGGTIKSTYRAIRQFLNGVEAQNILTVNGGTVEGANKAIWMQDPSKNANTGTLTVGENAVINGDIYLFVTAGSTEWPVTVSIAASAVNGEVLTGNVPGGLTVKNVNGVYVVAEGLSGSGTAEDPYLINCVADLVWLQKEVDKQAADGSTQFAGKYFKLTADLDLAGINWNPIGSMSGDHGSFLGIFDGDNHTISNLYVEQAGNGLGLFARTAGNAVIKNLNLQNVTVKSTNNSNYVGGLVGNAYASTKIENVHVTGYVYISGRGYIGGIAGHGYVVMDNVSVVANEGSIVTSTFWCAGGILGYAGEGTTNIMNAHVEGLTVTSAAGGLGAIVGMAEDNDGTQPISGSNLSAKNVEIKTYVGAYGTAYENYAIGYLYGGNETSKLTGVLSVENVTLTNASGNTPNVVDAVATVNGVVYFNLQEAIKAAAPNGTVELLRNTTVDEWKMITTKTIATGQLITLTIDGLTIDGNGHILTIKDVESAGNGGYLFDDAKNLTIKNLTINQPAGCGGIDLDSGVIENVTINGGWYGVVPGSEGVTITGCTFNGMVKHAIYIDEARNGIVITGNTFNTASGAYATIMYGTEKFTNNIIVTGRVNLANSSSATISGNDFGTERFKVYNGSTAIITNNKINNLVFNDPTDFVESTFTNNTLSTDAQAAIDALPTPVAKIGNVKYKTLADAIAAAKAGETVTVFAGTYAMPSMKAGITLEGVGNVMFEGTLSGTLENLTLKNIYIKGSNAQRWAYAKGNLVFENVTFEATGVYALHFDGIAAGTNLTYKNCTIIGWAAMGGTPASATFDGCTFKGNGTYGVIRTYFDATIKNCTFDVANVNTNDAYQDGIHAVEGAEVIVTGCTNANGSMEDIVNVHGSSVVTVDGKEIKNVAIVGDNYYTSLQAAIEAAAELYLQDKNQVPVIKLFADCAENVHIGDHGDHYALALKLDLNGKAYTGTITLGLASSLEAPKTLTVVPEPDTASLVYIFGVWMTTAHHLPAEPTVVPPTCVAEGYSVYKCSQPGCDVEFRGNYVAVNPDNHNYVAGTVVAPTVNTQGYTVYTCSYCDNSENRDFKPVLVAVAEINGTKYATLQEAIDAVQTGETVTIKLISDINYDGSEAFEGGKFKYSILHLVHGQEITIDFNGHKINVEITKQHPVLTGNLLVSVFFVEYGANVTFVDNSTEGNGGIYAKKSQVDNVILYCLIYNASATVTIESGNYVAEEVSDSLVYADKVNNTYIKGGFFNVMNYTQAKPWVSNVHGKNEGNFVEYTGGTFNHDPLVNRFSLADCEVYIPNGYAVVKNENGTWSVIEAAAKVGDEYFKTLAEAMAYCNKNAGTYTIELIDNVNEVFSFAQKKNVNITIDGNNKAFEFTGKITLTTGYGELKFTNIVITPKNSHTVYINAQSTPNVTFDNCILKGEGSGAIVWGQYSGGNAYITIKNCEASNLTYIVNIRMGGYHVYAENIKASDMTYLFRTNKCADVYVKNIEATKVVMPFEIKNDSTGTLTLENVTVDICPHSNGNLYAPVNGRDPDPTNTAHTFNIVLKGNTYFTHEGVKYEKTDWLVGNAGYKAIYISSISGNLVFNQDIGFNFTFNSEYTQIFNEELVVQITNKTSGEVYNLAMNDIHESLLTLVARQMADQLTVVVKCGDREISNTITTSVRAYYDAGVKANLFSGKDLELLNAMLHYGAEAQKAFAYNTNNLANAGFEAPETNVTPVNELEGVRYYGTVLNFGSHIVFNFKFLRDSLDVAYAKVTFADGTLLPGNTEETTYEVKYQTSSSGQLSVVKVENLVLTDATKLITCTLYDAEGNELRSATDSVMSYCARAIAGLTNMQTNNPTGYASQQFKLEFYQALANYVDALSNYSKANSNTNEGEEN